MFTNCSNKCSLYGNGILISGNIYLSSISKYSFQKAKYLPSTLGTVHAQVQTVS